MTTKNLNLTIKEINKEIKAMQYNNLKVTYRIYKDTDGEEWRIYKHIYDDPEINVLEFWVQKEGYCTIEMAFGVTYTDYTEELERAAENFIEDIKHEEKWA